MKVLRTKTQWYWDQNRQKKERDKKDRHKPKYRKIYNIVQMSFQIKMGKGEVIH